MIPTFVRDDGILTLEATQSTGGLLGHCNIMTAMGERAVDTLRPGDRVITRDQGMVVLDDLRAREVEVDLIRIAARSLGHNRPEEDTVLPTGQRVLIRDWRASAIFGTKVALVPVERLVDDEFVTRLPKARVIVYDLLFDDPHVVYVDGLEVASYIDEHAFF